MAIRLVIPGVGPADIYPRYPEHVTVWQSYEDPPPRWYRFFSSMQYDIRPVRIKPKGAGERPDTDPWSFILTPVVGRQVYTFDDWNDFITASREFTVDLFTKNFTHNVAQYRCHIGPPRQHVLTRLPPSWTWQDDGPRQQSFV